MTAIDTSTMAVERLAGIRSRYRDECAVDETMLALAAERDILSAALQKSEARLNSVEADMSQHVCHEDALQKSQADYDARIMAAIEPASDPRDAVIAQLVEVAQIVCSEYYDAGWDGEPLSMNNLDDAIAAAKVMMK